jgi:hypothetical protein
MQAPGVPIRIELDAKCLLRIQEMIGENAREDPGLPMAAHGGNI